MAEEKLDDEVVDIDYHFVKSNSFRSVHDCKFFGGTNGDDKVHVTVYTERPAIPKLQRIRLTKNGEPVLLDVGSENKQGVVFDIEVHLAMDVTSAEALRDLLSSVIDEIREDNGEQES